MNINNNPLENILFISLPEEAIATVEPLPINPKKLIPVEVPAGTENFDISSLTWEMIISAMLKILVYAPENPDCSYYRNFILSAQPNIVAQLTRTGIIKAEAKDFLLAEEIFLALKNLVPEEEIVILNLAFVYEEMADQEDSLNNFTKRDYYYDKAFNIYLEGLQKHTESADINFYIGSFFLKQNNYSKTIEYFEIFLGLASSDDERINEVSEVLERLKTQTQDDQLFEETFDLIRLGKEILAIEKIDDYLSRHENVWNAWFLKGWAERRLERYENGKKSMQQCMDLGQINADILNELAICCMELSEFEQSKKYLMQALQIEPDNVKIVSNLGVLANKSGNTDEAIRFFLIAKELDPNDPIVLHYLTELEYTE